MKKIVLFAVVLAMACAVAVWSQSGRPNRPGFGGPRDMGAPMISCPAMAVMPPHAGMIGSLAQTLRLTKAQTTKLNKIMADGDKKMHSLQQAAAKSSRALRSSILATKYNANSAKALSYKAEKAEAAVVSASIDEWTRIRSILTSKQSASLQKVISARPFGPGGPGGPGFPPPAMPMRKGAR